MKPEVVSLNLYRLTSICALAVLAAATCPSAAEHPANGRLVSDLPADYGTAAYGLPASWSRGDLTFGGPYPAAAELLPPERYMLAGTQPTAEGRTDDLPAWIESVADFCLDYYAQFSSIPDQLTAEEVQALLSLQNAKPSVVENALSINPITGTAPRVKAREFSAGDLYVRALDMDEMKYFAQRQPDLDDAWFKGRSTDPVSGRVASVELLSGVLYVRAYGSHGVIYENLTYRLSEPDYSVQYESSTPSYAAAQDISDWQPVEECKTSGG